MSLINDDEQNRNSWNEWSKYVLKELERLNKCVEALDIKQEKLDKEMFLMKFKAALVGAGISMITTIIITALVKYFFHL